MNAHLVDGILIKVFLCKIWIYTCCFGVIYMWDSVVLKNVA
jgi:hypothetical protein